jgi:hypothetical protein
LNQIREDAGAASSVMNCAFTFFKKIEAYPFY